MSARRYLEGTRDQAFNDAVAMWEHPRRVINRNLSNLSDVFHVNGGVGGGTYCTPNVRMLRGLFALGVISETNFNPNRFKAVIMERTTLFPGSFESDENYAYLTYQRLISSIPGKRSGYIRRHLNRGRDDAVFYFPMNDVYDLPGLLFMYVLIVASEIKEGGVYHAEYSIDPTDDIREQMKVITSFTKNRGNGVISLQAIIKIFNEIISSVYNSIHGFDHIAERSSWSGSDESGTRIVVRLRSGLHVTLRIYLKFERGIGVQPGGRWTEEIRKLLEEWFPTRCYLTTCNEEDDLCLIYCLILGVMCHEKNLWMTRETKIIPPETVLCRGVYDCDIKEIQVLCQSIMEGWDPIKNCAIEFGVEYTIKEFREKAQKIEDLLLTGYLEKYAMDIYVLEAGVLKHVYPVYMSKRDPIAGRISILCVQNVKGKGHYILVTKMEDIMRHSGGKVFYNCSRCGAAFYSRGALTRHKHNDDEEGSDSQQMHWSRSDVGEDAFPQGYCWKCMLQFPTVFEAQYHAEHCFMKNKSGYRYVKCLPCERELPSLHGVKINMETEEKVKKSSYIMYADFESVIDSETGEHQIMSWGLFDIQSEEYKSGYELGGFIHLLYEVGCMHSKIHVYFHNAMNYDGNFILRYVLSHEWTKGWEVRPIMKSSSRLQKLSFRFKDALGHSHTVDIGDTFLFLTLSLERIVNCIRKEDIEENQHNFPFFYGQFSKKYPDVDDSDIDMILRKNIFPYKFFSDIEKLNTPVEDFLRIFSGEDERCLQFFSENVTLEDLHKQYPHVCRVMEKYHCASARDYHDIYLMCDVLELADVFTHAIEALWESHHVFLPNYIGMPAASWAAFLRHDPMMEIPLYSATVYAEFFASMTRGGVTSAPLRYAKSDERHSIIYLDVNGLYPYVMQAYNYPKGYMMWVTFNAPPDGESWNEFLLHDLFPELYTRGEGMCLTVDLHYSEELKRMTDDFPFAPEHRVVYDEYFDEEGQLSEFLRGWSEANDGEKVHAFTGLVGTLYDKERYTVHWRLLEWYIKHGLEVTKVWWGVRFEEGDYLAGYVRKNIEIRNTRKDELGKMVYKLMGNSIYGKTFESPFKRGTFSIVNDPVVLAGLLEEGNVSTITPIDDMGWIVKMDGDEIVLDKPTYIGACVCEYAKLHMYELFYDKLKNLFPTVNLVYTDTDSVIVYLEHPPALSDPAKLFAYIAEGAPGLIGAKGGQVKSEIKDENGADDIISEVIALRSKVYAYKTRDGHIGKRAKGTTHAAQEMQLDWDAYMTALRERKNKSTTNMQFLRTRFDIFTKEVQRQSLSANDGKRQICPDGIHTHAWGFI